MFSEAVRYSARFTYPVVILKRFNSGVVECESASYLLLNDEGWALTAGHVMQNAVLLNQHSATRTEQESQIKSIESNTRLTDKQKRRLLRKAASSPTLLTNVNYCWGHDVAGTSFKAIIDPLADLALIKFDKFQAPPDVSYPSFGNPADELQAGTSLCRLGFPFHSASATFHPETNSFELGAGTFPMPRFPIDGIHTRAVIMQDQAAGRNVKFVETSTPGLRGQSGGPVFDRAGVVWGIQSRTVSLPLGFSPHARVEGKDVVENQFLNVGWASHVEEIAKFLGANGVNVRVARPKNHSLIAI
jgi:hypothetical protein